MNEPFDKETELRKLPVSTVQQLAQFLDGDDSILSLLMGSVVKDLDNPSSELRFSSNDIEMIRNHSQDIRKSSTLVFLDEWSTMGKNRPKLRHLLALLIKCQLFRAADYLASLIGEPQPLRPKNGPAARVAIDIELPEDIVEIVNGLNYPFSGSEVNRNKPGTKPEIAAPNMNFPSRSSNNGSISMPLIPVPSNHTTNSLIFNGRSTATMNTSKSDLMKFPPTVQIRQPSPPPPVALPSEEFIPNLSILQAPDPTPSTVNPTEQSHEQDENIPAISGLMLNGNSPNPSGELPAVLMSLEIPSRSQIDNVHSNSNLPMFSDLINGESSSQTRSQMSTQSTLSSTDDSD